MLAAQLAAAYVEGGEVVATAANPPIENLGTLADEEPTINNITGADAAAAADEGGSIIRET